MPWIVATIIVLLCCIQIHSFRLAQNQILVRRLGWEHFGSSFYRLARLDDVMDGVNLSVLVNVSSDAIHLRRKIAAWLDKEYIPQDIHQKLGRHVETEYCAIRKEGILDLGELLMRMGTALEKVDMEDAFVNAWDVANKASELLIDRLNAATNQGTLTKRGLKCPIHIGLECI